MKKLASLLVIFSLSFNLMAQFESGDPFDDADNELNIGGDIFSDFNEDLDAAQVAEDERFYRYSRFFSITASLAFTTFDGNRGSIYNNDIPGYGLGVNYFSDFQNTFGVGFEFSKHNFFLPDPVQISNSPLGFVDVSMLRAYFSFRHYIDTSNLGTAITYSNPYFIGRLEYWYVTNQFEDLDGIVPDDAGGGLGFGVGFGLEFPIKIKESYIGVEFLFHSVNFHDKFTSNFQPSPLDGPGGIQDLTGNVWSTTLSYVISF